MLNVPLRERTSRASGPKGRHVGCFIAQLLWLDASDTAHRTYPPYPSVEVKDIGNKRVKGHG